MDDISDELQCPVCLLIPREGPIPACPVGHIICKNCKGNLTTCPTCRRKMLKGGTNTIANKMIEKVPHPCKYGCQVKNYLKEIKEHEARCPERTIKCPFLGCNDQVQITEYQQHAMAKENSCNNYQGCLLRTIGSSFNIQTENGESLQSVLLRGWNWPMRAFEDHGKIFYFHLHFFSVEQTFAFYITSTSEADKYLAKMTLKNQNDVRKPLSITQNVIAMDSAPSDQKSVLASKSVMFVHWRTMSGFLKWGNNTIDGKQVSQSTIQATIVMLANS